MAADDKFAHAAQLYGVDANVLRRLHAREESDVPRNAAIARQARALGFAERVDVLPFQRRSGDAAG
jgi:hypothetical protein